MMYAPVKIKEVRLFLKGEDPDLDDVELGIVGGPSHILTGTSYHLGADQLKMSKNPYSVRTVRDRAGLSDAASALDVDDDLDELRELSVWCVQECRRGAPDTLDIREIIYSPDGRVVLRWDRERGVSSLPQPGEADLSHLTHSHFSWYRDSEHRDKVGLFKRFYGQGSPTKGLSDDMLLIKLNDDATVYISHAGQYRPMTSEAAFNAARKAGLPVVAVANMADLEDLAGRPEGEPEPVPITLSDGDREDIAARVAAKMPTAEQVAEAVLARKAEIATAVLDEDHARTAD